MPIKPEQGQSNEIRCPKCGKLLGSWEGTSSVRIDKVGLLVINADAMHRTCQNCGYLLDMVKKEER